LPRLRARDADSIAADVCAGFTCAGWYDSEALATFAKACAVVTYEFENVPVAPLAALGAAALHPGTRSLEVAQDRAAEKGFVEELGGRPAPGPRLTAPRIWRRPSRQSARRAS
jgi:5-(carboxyamino)imidazole ribonucleotide synthase